MVFSAMVQIMNTSHIKTDVKKLPNSQVEISVIIPIAEVETFRKKAIAQFKETVEIDEFRKGHVPESKLIEHVGETGLLAQMADEALTESYASIITQSNINPIGRPTIQITKLAPENDVEYVITTDVMPTITLDDVKKIAKEKNKTALETAVTDEEVEKALKEIRQMRAHQKMHEDGVDHHDHNHQNIDEKDLPEVDEAFVKSLGNFESVEDFMNKLKENMSKEKEVNAHEKRRIEIIESVIESGIFDMPESIVEFELNKMMEQFKYDLSMSGISIEEYAKQLGKTVNELRNDWHDAAVKRSKMQLALEKIATDYDIKPAQEKIDEQVAQITEQYKDQNIDEARVVAYVTQTLSNAAVFDWLEEQK